MYFLVEFFVKYLNIIDFIVLFNRSTTLTFLSLFVVKSLMFLSFNIPFTSEFRNSVPLSVCINFGCRLISIFSKACFNSLPVFVFNGSIHAYLLSTSMLTNKYLYPALYLASFDKSTKSICHYSSMSYTKTGLVLKFNLTGLCNV